MEFQDVVARVSLLHSR